MLGACTRLHPRAVPLADAVGLLTSVSLHAQEQVPPFANTAMDGYALRAADTPGPLRVVGTIAAGDDGLDLHVGPGEAVRIMTGAPIPDGADAIVMVERTRALDDGGVQIDHGAAAGDHIRHPGEDMEAGQEVFAAFTPVTPAVIGTLASLGLARVPVFPRARVGVLSTGDELVSGSQALRPGQIRDSNRPMLLAACRVAGFEPVDLGWAPDTKDAVAEAIRRGVATTDAVLTSGGVSMGDFDEVKVVLDDLSGGSFSWMQVAIKPAKPFAFGVIDEVPVFGLPGNPASSLVSFECFARPGIRARMGYQGDDRFRPKVTAVADTPFRRRADGRVHLLRVSATWRDDAYHVTDPGGQGSHLLRSAATANALAVVPDGPGVGAGETVETWLLG